MTKCQLSGSPAVGQGCEHGKGVVPGAEGRRHQQLRLTLTRVWREGQTRGGRFSPPPPNPVLATSGPRRLAHPRAQPRARNLTVPPPPILGTLTIP